ncbi:hypothetical protein Ao3042_01785 [Aspergillus oryzae 3.042]|uniref:Xylanolytic transcriptional activator regulatory domain-containing protein n=1 Tax=Aspergillus oryzae (strain 3.042) TaxID=1160506 RepID=I8A9Y2_ASPO3|nr:hypothetical protein Ao3042_01785 [Aspergillus oryzae 3.042]|eukprot:EIT81764.1 hypothetical protein Ao3042_01785 [Aspergillus oryzae 3.042]
MYDKGNNHSVNEALFQNTDSAIANEVACLPNIPASSDFEALDFLYSQDLTPESTALAERLEFLAYFTSAKGMATFLDQDTLNQWQKMLLDILFAPNNIRRFLGYFWSLWYPNCPIVHRPSFDPQTAPPTLLCVMVIIGACLSPHDGDGSLARMWLDTVEELVFSNEIFQERSAMATTPPVLEGQTEWKKRRVECLQMTYLVCSLQKREGSIEAQTRSRRYRHAMMVTVSLFMSPIIAFMLTLEQASERSWSFCIAPRSRAEGPFRILVAEIYCRGRANTLRSIGNSHKLLVNIV